MAITITRNPAGVSLTGNPITFEALSDLYGSKDFLKLNIRIEKQVGESWVSVGGKVLAPNTLASAKFSVEKFLETEIKSAFTWPVSTFIIAAYNQRVVYRAVFWESYFENGMRLTTDEVFSETFWAMNGGVDEEMEAEMNDTGTNFQAYWLENGKFLTWMPRTMTVGANQPLKLYYLALPGSGTVIKLKYKYVLNGENYIGTAHSTGINSGIVYELNVGPNVFNSLIYGSSAYFVWLENENGEHISETFTFNVDRNTYQRNTYLLFKNSLGGYDTLWCRGLLTKGHKISSTTVERSRAIDISGSDPTITILKNSRQALFTLSTGIIKNALEFDWLEEFFASEKIYTLENNYAYNVVLETNNYSGDSDFREPRSVKFTFKSGFVKKFFGKKLDVSAGTPGEFNFDFNDDYNIGSADASGDTPTAETIISTEYRCVLNANGVNTGEQEKRHLYADGTGGTYYGDWYDTQMNTLACPLPPTTVSLEIVSNDLSTLVFRAVVDRGIATENYTVPLSRNVTMPEGYIGLTNPEAIEQIPASLTINEGSAASNTVIVDKSDIYSGAVLTIAIPALSLTPSWLMSSAAIIEEELGTKQLPASVKLQAVESGDITNVYLIISNAGAGFDVVVSENLVNDTYAVAQNQSILQIASLNRLTIPFNSTFSIQSVPQGVYISSPSTVIVYRQNI